MVAKKTGSTQTKKTAVKKAATKPAAKSAVKKTVAKKAAPAKTKTKVKAKAKLNPKTATGPKKSVKGTMRKQAGSSAKNVVPLNDSSRIDALAIAHLALEKKASEVLLLDVRNLTSYTDYFVVMTAESEPQLDAIADHIERKMKESGQRSIGVEGLRSGNWVLVDFGHVVAHVFNSETRGFYDLEGLWADAPRHEVTDAPKTPRTKAK